MPSSDPALICLTPVRNEAWILDRFLRCARLWADHIVVVDHCSTDGSREIAREFPKVTLVEYDETSFDEPERRRLLIETARSLEPDRQRILLALDADEAFTRWDNAPGCSRCWLDKYVASGYVDDGRPFDICAIPFRPGRAPTQPREGEAPALPVRGLEPNEKQAAMVPGLGTHSPPAEARGSPLSPVPPDVHGGAGEYSGHSLRLAAPIHRGRY